MGVYLRDTRTGEIREVEGQSDEFFDLVGQTYDNGAGQLIPAFEQTGKHYADRVDSGDITEADHGYEDKPVEPVLNDPGSGPAEHPERELTPGERDAGIKDWAQKEKELAQERKASSPEVLKQTDPGEREASARKRVGRKSPGGASRTKEKAAASGGDKDAG